MIVNSVKVLNPKFQFGSKYEVDASTATNRNQIFTLGMLMNNFWVRNAKDSFVDLKYKSVYGTTQIEVNEDKAKIVETILKKNNIKFKKLDETIWTNALEKLLKL